MKTKLLDQIRDRRLALGVKIQDMTLLAGLSRQQYGKIESGGNPRLNTLDQIAEGLDASLMLIPKDKLDEVAKLLAGVPPEQPSPGPSRGFDDEIKNPWGDL